MYNWGLMTVGFAMVYTVDNVIKYLLYVIYIRGTKSLRKHFISLNLEYFERTGVKID